MTLPPGFSRKDVSVQLVSYEPRRGHDDLKFVLYDRKWKKLAEVKGNYVRQKFTYTTTHHSLGTPDGPMEWTDRIPNEAIEEYTHIVTDTGIAETIRMRGCRFDCKQNGIFVALFYVIDDSDASKEISGEVIPPCLKKEKKEKGLNQNIDDGPCAIPEK